MKKEKQPISISEECCQIINGYVMGDGYLKKQGTLTVDQGEKQLKFVEWLHDKLKPICTPTGEIKPVPREYKGKVTKSFRFNTRAVLKDYYENWYKPVNGASKNKKQLPTNIADLFTPLFITVWFACDGTKIIGSRGAKFEVTSISPTEREVLKNLFESMYNIRANIIRSGKSKSGTDQWALAINASEYDKFRSLITQIDLIQNLFPYKLHKQS